MFGWFTKKSPPTEASALRPRPSRNARRSGNEAPQWDTSTLLPEVQEGNSDADWSAWEDSVNFQESRSFAKTEPAPLSAQTTEIEQVFEQEARRKNR